MTWFATHRTSRQIIVFFLVPCLASRPVTISEPEPNIDSCLSSFAVIYVELGWMDGWIGYLNVDFALVFFPLIWGQVCGPSTPRVL